MSFKVENETGNVQFVGDVCFPIGVSIHLDLSDGVLDMLDLISGVDYEELEEDDLDSLQGIDSSSPKIDGETQPKSEEESLPTDPAVDSTQVKMNLEFLMTQKAGDAIEEIKKVNSVALLKAIIKHSQYATVRTTAETRLKELTDATTQESNNNE